MAKCFVTGVEISLDEAYVLDGSAARRLLRDLRQRVASLQRLIEQLGSKDSADAVD